MKVEGMRPSSATCRQPDYFIGASGIPQLVGKRSKMDRTSSSRSSSISVTDSIKLKKCLYNLTVRNGTLPVNSGSKIESDIAIRSQYGNKSNSATNHNSIGSTAIIVSPTYLNSPSSSSSVLSNRRGFVASPATDWDVRRSTRRTRINSSSIPRSRNHNSTSRDVTQPASRSASNSNNSIRINSVIGGTRTLLSHRQQRNAIEAVDSNRVRDCGCSVMRQCSFSAVVQKPPAADNRLNYQRKYDRTIFGYNRLDQIVLPPLQI